MWLLGLGFLRLRSWHLVRFRLRWWRELFFCSWLGLERLLKFGFFVLLELFARHLDQFFKVHDANGEHFLVQIFLDGDIAVDVGVVVNFAMSFFYPLSEFAGSVAGQVR